MSRALPLLAGVLIHALLSVSVSAQIEESSAESVLAETVPFAFSIVVRDAAGDFVSSLVKEDFRLMIEGIPAEIVSLVENRPLAPTDSIVTGYVVSSRERARDGLPPPEPPMAPRNIVLVFDTDGLNTEGMERAAGLARTVIERVVLPWDNVFVYRLDGAPLRFAGPTSERETLTKAVVRATSLAQAGRTDQSTNAASNLDELVQRILPLAGHTAVILFTERKMSPGQTSGHNESKSTGEDGRNYGIEDINKQEQSFSVEDHFPYKLSQVQLFRALDGPAFVVDCSAASERIDENEGGVLDAAAESSVGGTVLQGRDSDLMVDMLIDGIGSYYRIKGELPKRDSFELQKIQLSFSVALPFEVENPEELLSLDHGQFAAISEENAPSKTAESFPVVAGNDLPTKVRLLQARVGDEWGAFTLIEIEASKLPHSVEEPFELERIISVEDVDGQLIHHSHRHYLADAKRTLPETVWLLDAVPLSAEGCRVRILLRDVNGGLIFLKSITPQRDVSAAPYLSEPFLLNSAPPGNAANWRSAEIDDGIVVDARRPLELPLLPGVPAHREVVEQGNYATLYSLISGLPGEVGASTVNVAVTYTLEGDSHNYLLRARNQRILPLPDGRTLALIAEVPLGLAQQADGVLRIEVGGIKPEMSTFVRMHFSVLDFESERAADFLKRDDIELLPLINEEPDIKQ